MTAHWSRLFAPSKEPSSVFGVVWWWESRRLAYNAIVGAVGIVSFCVYAALVYAFIIKPGEDDGFGPLVPAIAFGVLANVCYTLGWIVESSLLVVRRRGSPSLGPRLFKAGVMFSLVLALLPPAFAALTIVGGVVHGALGGHS